MSDFELAITLTYNHSMGSLTPYFEGLRKGQAWAVRCEGCGRVWFAPRLHCCASEPVTSWLELAGTGVIAAATNGTGELPFSEPRPRDAMALIKMDGAHNQVLGWVDGLGKLPEPGTRVRLIAADGAHAHPAQSAVFVAA